MKGIVFLTEGLKIRRSAFILLELFGKRTGYIVIFGRVPKKELHADYFQVTSVNDQLQKCGKTGNELIHAVRSGIDEAADNMAESLSDPENHIIPVTQCCYERKIRKGKMIFFALSKDIPSAKLSRDSTEECNVKQL